MNNSDIRNRGILIASNWYWGLQNGTIPAWIISEFQALTIDIYRDLSLPRYQLTEEDHKRLALDCILFGAYLVLRNEAPKHIRRRTLFTNKIDLEGMRVFSEIFVAQLEVEIRSGPLFGTKSLLLVPDGNNGFVPSPGEAVIPRKRLLEYIDAGDIKAALDLLSTYLVLSIDPVHGFVFRQFTLNQFDVLVEAVESTVNEYFADV